MIKQIYEFSDYKGYLRWKIREVGRVRRGVRLKLAKHIGCQPSYLSQVLHRKPHLTLEQAHILNSFFSHDKVESKYFMLLVEVGRAGTKDLKQYYWSQIEEIRETRFNLKKRLTETQDIPEAVRQKYYSAWFYSAIHVLLSVPEYQNALSIAQHFNLPVQLVSDVISFLENAGLIENKGGIYVFSQRRIHLERDSTFIQNHHINWRSQALQSVEKNLIEDMHYSNVFAFSKKDVNAIREVLIEAIEKVRSIIRPSKEEAIYALTLDFFKM